MIWEHFKLECTIFSFALCSLEDCKPHRESPGPIWHLGGRVATAEEINRWDSVESLKPQHDTRKAAEYSETSKRSLRVGMRDTGAWDFEQEFIRRLSS